MMHSNNYIETNPTQKDYEECVGFLTNEFDILKEGFFVNLSVIRNCFNESRLIVYKSNECVLGFCCFTPQKDSLVIEIYCIDHDKRGKGLGVHFYSLLKNKFGSSVKMFKCDPICPKSHKFWIDLGFTPEDLSDRNVYSGKKLNYTL